jgi:hypothetical protein
MRDYAGDQRENQQQEAKAERSGRVTYRLPKLHPQLAPPVIEAMGAVDLGLKIHGR